jgi:hypothetical protein
MIRQPLKHEWQNQIHVTVVEDDLTDASKSADGAGGSQRHYLPLQDCERWTGDLLAASIKNEFDMNRSPFQGNSLARQSPEKPKPHLARRHIVTLHLASHPPYPAADPQLESAKFTIADHESSWRTLPAQGSTFQLRCFLIRRAWLQ